MLPPNKLLEASAEQSAMSVYLVLYRGPYRSRVNSFEKVEFVGAFRAQRTQTHANSDNSDRISPKEHFFLWSEVNLRSVTPKKNSFRQYWHTKCSIKRI
jgi:hypothetical protein